MQTLSFQQNTGFNTGALIKRNQPIVAEHDNIRSAVRAWAGAEGQDVVSGCAQGRDLAPNKGVRRSAVIADQIGDAHL